jgi:adenylate kinase family enzyme
MKRLCIIGSPGSGKSTLAKQLGEILKIEIIHMDQLFWKPGWKAVSTEELEALQEMHLQKDTWIMDGSYSCVWQTRFERADTIIFLDISRWICLTRVMKRVTTHYNRTRSDMAKGCPEKIDFPFWAYIWNYPSHKRNKVLEVMNKYKVQKQVITLRNSREVTNFLYKIKQGDLL